MTADVAVPIAGIVMIIALSIGTPIAIAYARRISRGAPPAAGAGADTTARLERMEQAIEAIATEVERISEGQRFTTKLLAESQQRADATRLPAPDSTRPVSHE